MPLFTCLYSIPLHLSIYISLLERYSLLIDFISYLYSYLLVYLLSVDSLLLRFTKRKIKNMKPYMLSYSLFFSYL